MTTHVVQYSGGIGSWAATQRVIAEHGAEDLVLLFADTRAEDDDLYRFLRDSAAQIGVPVTVVADGRTPFQLFRDQRFLVLSPRRHLSEPGIARCLMCGGLALLNLGAAGLRGRFVSFWWFVCRWMM